MWIAVWTRAVVAPAWRRATAVWAGSAIVGGVIFGGAGMHPHDLTGLALSVPGFGIVLATIWLLLFVPSARLLVRPTTDAFLRSLPAPHVAPRVITALAIVGLQLPWLVLWGLGEHARGLAIVGGFTCVIVAIAYVPLPRRRVRTPAWRDSLRALAAIYARALVRTAGDAVVRGIGLALLAGVVGGLFIRNNAATGAHAAVLGTASSAIVLVASWTGVLLPLVEARRATLWLQLSLGMSTLRRTLALFVVVAAVHLASFAVAIVAAMVVARGDAMFVVVALACAVGSAGMTTRSLLHADRDATDAPRDAPRRGPAATRVVIGAIAAAGVIVIALAALSAAGAIMVLVLGAAAVISARST